MLGEKTVLTFWCHENEPWIKSYEAMAEKFEEANPEYDVQIESYPMNVYRDKIQTALINGTGGSDVIAIWGDCSLNRSGLRRISLENTELYMPGPRR